MEAAMNGWLAAWMAMRIVRWGLWIGLLVYSAYFLYDRAPHLTQFGHLKLSAELFMFGLPLGAVTAGFLELMFRDRAHGPPEGLKR
jgi:hypothetical protein